MEFIQNAPNDYKFKYSRHSCTIAVHCTYKVNLEYIYLGIVKQTRIKWIINVYDFIWMGTLTISRRILMSGDGPHLLEAVFPDYISSIYTLTHTHNNKTHCQFNFSLLLGSSTQIKWKLKWWTIWPLSRALSHTLIDHLTGII